MTAGPPSRSSRAGTARRPAADTGTLLILVLVAFVAGTVFGYRWLPLLIIAER